MNGSKVSRPLSPVQIRRYVHIDFSVFPESGPPKIRFKCFSDLFHSSARHGAFQLTLGCSISMVKAVFLSVVT